MSLERINLNLPMPFQEAKTLEELKQRLVINFNYLVNELRANVVVDPSILPAITGGEAETVATTVATNETVQDEMLIGMFLG